MAQQNYSQSEVFLRQLFDNEVPQQFQDEASFIKNIAEKKPGKWVNQKGWQITGNFVPDSSVGNFSAGGAFPAGGVNTYANMYVGYVRQGGTVEFDSDTFDDMSKGKESAAVSVADRLKSFTSAQIREMEEQAWGLGDGVKAVVGTGSSTSSIVLTTTETTTPMTSKGSQFLYENRPYDWYNSSGTLQQANITLTAVAKQGTTPTATPSATLSGSPSSTDVLVHAGSYNKAARGLPYLFANGSGLKQGLLQSSYPQLKSPIEDLAGAVLTPSVILRMINKIRYRRGLSAGNNLTIISSPAMNEAYNRSGFNFLRFGTGDTYDGVIKNSKMAGFTVMENVCCDEGTITIFDPTVLGRIEKKPFGFFKEDGLMYRQKQGTNGTGASAIYANAEVYWNLYVTVPGAGGRIVRGSVSGLSTEATAWAA